MPDNEYERHKQRDYREARLARDEMLIELFAESNTDMAARLPLRPSGNATTVLLADGNYAHTISLADGATQTVVNLGHEWGLHAIAAALLKFPTLENQLGIYTVLYEMAPEMLRSELGLPPPDMVGADASTFNQILVSAQSVLLDAIDTQPANPVPLNCDDHSGRGNDGDREGCTLHSRLYSSRMP